MRQSPLKTAVLGLGDEGQLLLEAAKELDYFTIAAVADGDASLAQQTAALLKCEAYDDYRQLIITNQFDCLFVAAPIHTCAEYLKMALKKKFNVFKLPPLARNFSETTELVKLAQSEEVTLALANTGRFAKPALAMRDFILQHSSEQVLFVLAAAGWPDADKPQPKWRKDLVLAGGGVILYDCWEVIDQIVCNFGVPQQVYCLTGSTAADKQQRLYLTEDSAVATMKFSDTFSGGLLAGRAAYSFGQVARKLLIAHGQNILLRVDDKCFEVTDPQGQCLRREGFEDDFLSGLKKALKNFGSHLLSPDKNPLISTAADYLKHMAFVEAAYVSARTGMPEEPGRILNIA
jgi:predicted dehydrogenase